MEMIGADVQELRQLSQRVTRTGEKFDRAARDLTSALARSAWQGHDAQAFRDDWNGHLRASLVQAGVRLKKAGQSLVHQADEQERASSEGGAWGGGSSGGGSGDAMITWPWEDDWKWPWQDDRTTVPVEGDIPLDQGQFTNDNTGQRSYPDCVVVSALAEMGVDDAYLREHIVRNDDGTYTVTLFDGDGNPVEYTIDSVGDGGVRGPDGSQIWMTLYEEALIQHGMLNEDGTYADGAVKVFQAVTGAEGTRTFDGDDGYPSFSTVAQAAKDGTPLVVGTTPEAISDADARAAGVVPLQIVENHAYMVTSVNRDGTVTLTNPWGSSAGYSDDTGTHHITISAEQYDLYFHSAYAPAPRQRLAGVNTMRNHVMQNESGVVRAQIVQGLQAEVGPLLIGVMAAREGALDDGSTGLFAKLRILSKDDSWLATLRPTEVMDLDGLGTLTLVGVQPPAPDQPQSVESTNRGVIAVEFRPLSSAG